MAEVVQTINCAKCGAPLRIKKGEAVIVCEYCGTANSLRADRFYIVAHSWMPNKLDKEDVIKRAREWMGGGMLGPSDLGRSEITKVELVYLPLWVFRTRNSTRYVGLFQRGEQKRIEGTEERELFWKVLGRREAAFPVMAYHVPLAQKVPFAIEEAIEGIFLNGELDEEEAKALARQQIAEHMRRLASEKVDSFERCDTETRFMESEFLHVPIWFIEYRYRGRPYKLYIEGTGGEVVKGEVPPAEFAGREVKIIMAVAAFLVLLVACGAVALVALR